MKTESILQLSRINSLLDLFHAVKMICDHVPRDVDAQDVYIQGCSLRIALVEERLTDGSSVYNIGIAVTQ